MRKSVGLNIFRYFLFIVQLHLSGLYAQKTHNEWYFGNATGIDFNSGTPTVISNSSIIAAEGCANICDKDGNVLFYTNAETIWDKSNTTMLNGTGLGESTPVTTTQSSLILPLPDNPQLYYVFSLGCCAYGSLVYSIVDITKNNGLGEVISANNIVTGNLVEKLTAVKHCNGTDYWIIVHKSGNNSFYAYRFSSSGIDIANPIISNVGISHTAPFPIWGYGGYLKASVDGSKLACASLGFNKVEVFNFNANTGSITDIGITISSITSPYGVEFSPDGSKLYISSSANDGLFQFNLNAGSPNTIISSAYQVTSSYARGLQLGPDRKIHIAAGNTLEIIKYPDSLGVKCNYDFNGTYLLGKSSGWGLPNYQAEYWASITGPSSVCNRTSYTYSIKDQTSWDNYSWAISGNALIQGETTANSINILPFDTGYATLILTQKNANCGYVINQDTLMIHILSSPIIDLGMDTVICDTTTLILDAKNNGSNYEWSTGDTSQQIQIYSSGNYALTVKNNNQCSANGNINIIVNNCDLPSIYLPSAFTPNNDGINDTYAPLINNGSIISMRIYNRWGNLIYEANNTINPAWNGKMKGIECQEDIYLCKLDLVLNDEHQTPKSISSLITLMR